MWHDHLKKLRAKLSRQRAALTALAASTWGCRLGQAREIYTKVVRSAIAYGASTFHTPTNTHGKARGAARGLAREQSACLRIVLGAYKATPIRSLETQAAVPPLDIYLNERVARFEARLETTGMAGRIRTACARVARTLPKRRGPWRAPGAEKATWLRNWHPGEETPMLATEAAWKER